MFGGSRGAGVGVGSGAALGYLGRQNHPDMVEVIERAIARIIAAGSPAGILTTDETLARQYMKAGCVFTAVGLDTAILARGAEALVRTYKAE